MGIPVSQFQAMQDRVNRNGVRDSRNAGAAERIGDAPLESALHLRIMEFCDSKWPRWKYLHARMDRRSTIAVGAQDFTVFLPAGKTVLIECKRKGEKRSVDQSAWAMEMERIGHKVHLVTSMDEFLDVLKGVL